MATYAISDIHGHVRPFDRILEHVSLGSGDRLYVLGDLVDRGPDPGAVIDLVRSLPNTVCLLGNHEDIMMSFYEGGPDADAAEFWAANGGVPTSVYVDSLTEEERDSLFGWVRSLPLSAHVTVSGRRFILVHAGIDPARVTVPAEWSDEAVEDLLDRQSPAALAWIREGFWDVPTGLVDERGEGPVVVAGHTPTCFLRRIVGPEVECEDETGLGLITFLGATPDTGWTYDKIDIDCGAAKGFLRGRLGMLRLDDLECFYENVRIGE